MSEQYEEMVETSARKIKVHVTEELLDTLYDGVQSGKIKFDMPNLEKAVAEILGKPGVECLEMDVQRIYAVLKYRLSAPVSC